MVWLFSTEVQQFRMIHIEVDHAVFFRYNGHNKCIYLLICVVDIVIKNSDHDGISQVSTQIFV